MNANLPATACDAERLESFLRGALCEALEHEFTLHLNSCESCRRSLAEQAAEPEAWREAEMLLKPSPFDSQNADEPNHSTRQPLQIQNVLDALAPTDDPAMLGRLGGYEVSGVVGAGGMGVVLKAIDPSLDRTVAIKVMAPHLAASGAARKRFAREAKAAAAVLHPNVIAIHSVSKDEALPYLVMPYVRGNSLQKRLDREGPLPLQEILRIAAQIAAGLAAAHAQGLVHRDIKPANILLEEGVERVTITDFGLARAVDDATITHSGMIAGTPQYMSPEQARGEAVDPRSDLFSLGSVMYAICTGRPPFRAETSYGVMRRITDDQSTAIGSINPDIPPWLCQIISKLMSKQAADRYESAAEVAELLEACLAHVQQPMVAELPLSLKPAAKSSRFLPNSRRWTGVIAMIAVVSLGMLGILAWQATEAPDIAGQWFGPEWGEVVLMAKQPGEYEGTYTDTFKEKPGTIEVQWSRFEGRFKGTWREGQNRSGKISLRLVENEIRGAWTTSEKSEIKPGTPELADLTWKRNSDSFPPTVAATDATTMQLRIAAPEKMEITVADQQGEFGKSALLLAPARLNLDPGNNYRLKLTNIAGRDGAEFYPTIETSLIVPRIAAFLAHNSIPLSFTEEDFDQALTQNFVTKVVYLPDPEFQELALTGVETLVSSRLEPGKDPVAEADRRGSILAVIRLGNKDVELPGARERNGINARTLEPADLAGKHSPSTPPDAASGICVRVLLSPETHSREMLTKNIGFDQLSVMGSGITGTIDGKAHTNLVAVMAHRCRLESFEETEHDGKKYWTVTLFVPQSATSDGSNLGLSQQRLDGMLGKGVQFWLDHHRDQLLGGNKLPVIPTNGPKGTAGETNTQSLAAAAKQFNAETAQARKELFTPPIPDLTVERLQAGFRQTAELYRRQGKHQIANTLQTIADRERFPAEASELIATGVHARDDAGRTVSRQIVPGFTIPSAEGNDRREFIVLRPLELIYRQDGPDSTDYGDPSVLAGDGTEIPAATSGPIQLSEPRELVLSMNSTKFMLDLDTGDTMDPPAAIRPEQAKMDIHPNQIQPYHYPTALVGVGLVGMEMKESDWHAAVVDVRRALEGREIEPLKEMDQGPEKHPTYFFKTRDGTCGILQLLEIVDKPKGMRLRYKTIESKRQKQNGDFPGEMAAGR
jgi:serine/threonine protein kinase